MRLSAASSQTVENKRAKREERDARSIQEDRYGWLATSLIEDRMEDMLGHIHMGTWQVMDAVDECIEINRLILIIFPRIYMTNNRMTKKV